MMGTYRLAEKVCGADHYIADACQLNDVFVVCVAQRGSFSNDDKEYDVEKYSRGVDDALEAVMDKGKKTPA